MSATIRRRILVTYRVDADVARRLVPEPLALRLVDGWAVGGVCLIGLDDARPSFAPAGVGIRSENAAHRIAVEWGPSGERRPGVFIPRRDSSSWLPVLAGGRVIPGVHGRADFDARDGEREVVVRMSGAEASVDVAARIGPWTSRLFPNVEDASEFYRSGVIGWSPTRDGRWIESLALSTDTWRVEPAEPSRVVSSYFDALPPGSVELDSVLVMRGIGATLAQPSRADAPRRVRIAA